MALDLRYNSPQTGTSLGGAALFNGNIIQMMWASTSSAPEQTGSAPAQAGYGFTYDGLNRLRSAAYADGAGYTSNAGRYSTTYSYDANGNMATLTRNLDGNQVDNLGYTYYSGGNRLQAVADNVTSATYKALGYKAASGNYEYDNNGNMTKDISKGFIITYNSLNLPQLVSSSVTDYARYTYDAAGTKLAKTVVTNGTAENILNYRYSGIFLYEGKENLTLTSIFTPEGRIVPQNNGTAMSYSYEYNLKDHLGNTRVTFTGHANGRPEVNQLTSYDPYGLVTSQTSFYPTGASKNKLLYNGKELQDDVLAGTKIDWFDYGARMYDPELGRWHSPDPLEQYESGYVYAGNNPILMNDPSGMWAESSTFVNYIASSFVDPNGTVIEHRDDGDPKVYLVNDVGNWRKNGSKKEDAEHVGYEYPGVDYASMVGKPALYYPSKAPTMPGFLNDGPIEEDYTLESILIPLPAFAWVKLGKASSKLLWGFWEDFAKVTYKGKIYAKIGGRLYARHAVDRMLPSALGKAAGGEAGRSIPTSIVEEVIRSGNKTTRLVDGIVRTEHIMGNVSVVTEEAGKVVVTVMRK